MTAEVLPEDNDSPYFTLEQARKYCCVSADTLQRWWVERKYELHWTPSGRPMFLRELVKGLIGPKRKKKWRNVRVVDFGSKPK